MKSILMNFKDNVLSKEEMKSLKGGYEDQENGEGGCGAHACTESTDCLTMHCDGGCHDYQCVVQ